MKTIGIIGGMSWESSATYYRLINEGVARRLGALHSARLVLYSVDFDPIERMQTAGDWRAAGRMLADAAVRLEAAGADFLVLATNTMHKVADSIERSVAIPLLHIADATGTAIAAAGIRTVGLLGTRYTMEQDFYRDRLACTYDLEVLVPGPDDRALVDDVIFRELVLGRVEPASKRRYLEIIDRLATDGAEGVVLGCTEIGMLVGDEDVTMPVFDTTELHAEASIEASIEPSDLR
jgi:aspartate racemase